MDKSEEELIELSKTFRNCADDIDKLLELSKREEKGEDVKEESETILGRFAFRLMKLKGFF